MGINSPIPTSLSNECLKCSKIIAKFNKPESGQIDKVIPRDVLSKAKGIAIMTVIKAGFVWSGRAGSGLVIARLSDGSWSAPSAIGTAGMGFGGQIGGEITDFVIILNTVDAVKAFSLGGNVTLGGNLSVAAGPYGRAGGAIGKFAPIYSYSKSKGLFAGISIEGSVIIERKDANAQFYNRRISSKEILTGQVPQPTGASPLYRALDRQANTESLHPSSAQLSNKASSATILSSANRNSQYEQLKGSSYSTNSLPRYEDSRHVQSNQQSKPIIPVLSPVSLSRSSFQSTQNSWPIQSSTSIAPEKPYKSPPPLPPHRLKTKAKALYDYVAERESDLSFSAGDLIVVSKKTDNSGDWWTGYCNGSSGDFPANYVKLL